MLQFPRTQYRYMCSMDPCIYIYNMPAAAAAVTVETSDATLSQVVRSLARLCLHSICAEQNSLKLSQVSFHRTRVLDYPYAHLQRVFMPPLYACISIYTYIYNPPVYILYPWYGIRTDRPEFTGRRAILQRR